MQIRKHMGTARCWLLFTGLIAAWVTLAVAPVRARQQDPRNSIHVIGSSRIHANEISAAREDAVSAGLIEAVSRVLTRTASAETVTGNFQVLNEKIFSRTDQFINGYKVLAESKNGSTYLVMVQAEVAADRLQKILDSTGIRAVQKSSARVLLLVAEKLANDFGYTYWWSADRMGSGPGQSIANQILEQRLTEAGFEIIEPDPNGAFSSYPAELSVSEASAIGQQMQADVVVVGTAVVQENSPGEGSPASSFQATVQMHAYRSENGSRIAESRQSASIAEDRFSSGRQALVQAASLSGQDLSSQISQAWSSAAAAKSNIEIVVAGTGGNIANFVKLRGALSTMSGVDDVQLKEMRQDAAVLNVDYQGNARALADTLLLQNFDNFGIEISQIGLNTISMQLVQR